MQNWRNFLKNKFGLDEHSIFKTCACPGSNAVVFNKNWSPDVITNARNRNTKSQKVTVKNLNGLYSSKHGELLIPLKKHCTAEIAGKELVQKENKSKAKQNLYIKEKKKWI